MQEDRTQKAGVSSKDLFEIPLPSDPQISPDGSRISWVETRMDKAKNAYNSWIYITDCVSGVTTRLTSGPQDSRPRWSPDGSMLAFLGRRPLKVGNQEISNPQIYVMKAEGGDPWPITDLRSGAGAPAWSPDGNRIAFVTRIDERKGLWRMGDPDPADADPYLRYNEDVLIIRRRKWKANGVPFIANTRSHVVVVDVTSGPEAKRSVPRLAVGGELDVNSFCWDPTGRYLAFVTQNDPQPGKGYVKMSELRIADVDGSPTTSRLVVRVSRLDSAPSWSPDGKTIAVIGHDDPRGGQAHNRLLAVDADGSNWRCLARTLDRSVGDSSVTDTRTASHSTGPVWCTLGRALLVQMNDAGRVHLLRIALDGESMQLVTRGDQQVVDYSVSEASGRLALLISDFFNPGDLYVADIGDGNPKRLTSLNEEFLNSKALSVPERFTVKADDGAEIEGWALRPVGYEAEKKYPTILEIHGGPDRHYGYAYLHEFQLLASRGYAVIFGNPRGSQGYSEEFSAAIKGDRGNRDYRDIMEFVEGAVAQHDFIDPGRIGVAGGSYGGFMTNWIIGHTSRFKAAVTMRSVVNNYTEFGTGDSGYQREDEYGGGGPWENPEGYMKTSPIKYIGNCTTPTMVIHSDLDMRCPVDQGELLYAALFRLGIPTEFVRFPGENHELSRGGKPWHRVLRLDKIVEWFDRWLLPARS